jgi:hypothetical protein
VSSIPPFEATRKISKVASHRYLHHPPMNLRMNDLKSFMARIPLFTTITFQ